MGQSSDNNINYDQNSMDKNIRGKEGEEIFSGEFVNCKCGEVRYANDKQPCARCEQKRQEAIVERDLAKKEAEWHKEYAKWRKNNPRPGD